MDISLYIADLLEEHEYVIVPGLGAFISTYRPAKFNEDRTILLPPSRAISFDPALKINDGLLTKHIAQQQKITLTQASGLLEKFTGDVMYQLDLGEAVSMGEIGSFTLKKGELMFIPVESSRENSESFGLQPVMVSDYVSIPEKKEEIPEAEKSKKRFSQRIWIGSLLLILLIALTLYILFFADHRIVRPAGPVIQKDTLVNELVVPTVSTDSTIAGQNEMKPVTKDEVLLQPRKELYYMIGGSFRSQQNATEYSETMSLKGFHPFQLLLYGNFYLVALDSFKTAQEAYEAADQNESMYRNTEVWIFHPK